MNVEKLSNWLASFKEDIRAEVLVDDILTNLNPDDEQILIGFEGQFTRSHRHDILSSSVVDFELNSKQVLKILLSRDNIYNTLPEAVTHVGKNDISGQSIETKVKSYRDQKLQSEAAKKFFSPFQNEIFFSKVKLENIEKKIFFGLEGNKPLDFQYEFWGISRDLPELLVSKLVRLLPYKYKFMGNLELVMECLSYLLEEQVSFEKSEYKEHLDENQGINLGNTRLGIDFIAGSSFTDYSLHISISIGPLEKNHFSEFIYDTPVKKFLDLFYQMFLPIEIEITTKIVIDENEELFKFSNDDEPTLGYTTRI